MTATAAAAAAATTTTTKPPSASSTPGAPSPLAPLSNRLATLEQLAQSASGLDGIPDSFADSIRYQGCVLTQAAGILLRLAQDIIAQAIIIFTRFYTGLDGGSFRVHAAKDISAACLYLSAKSSATPVTTRSLLNVFEFLASTRSGSSAWKVSSQAPSDPTSYTLTPGGYERALLALQQNEGIVLRTLGFETRSVLPHGLALTYLSTLGQSLTSNPEFPQLARQTLALLNSALLSPQRLYLTHQPSVLAVAAVYLAARQTGTRLISGNVTGAESWWEVFDVDREQLGFLCVAMLSLTGWVEDEQAKGLAVGNGGTEGHTARWLLDIEQVEAELKGVESSI